MKQSSTFILRSVVMLVGVLGLALYAVGLPVLITSEMSGDFDYGPVFVGLYVPAVPFFVALYQSLKLLGYIDENKTFTNAAVQALRHIKNSALIFSGLFAAGQPYVFWLADRDDAPGLAALGFVLIGASFVVGVAAGLFQRLLQNAVDIKSENDLTV